MHTRLKDSINHHLKILYTQSPSPHPENELLQLKKRYAGCTQCPLARQGRTQVVFGTGPATASLMIIGEAPGRDEDLQGMPFVGRSGKLLTTLLASAGINRANVYISNIAKCRPPENRPPTPVESATCSSLLLLHEIAIIRPRIIFTLGATATNTFIDSPLTISALRGSLIDTPYFSILPTYHPSYVLRNKKAGEIVISDFLKVDNHR